MRIERAVWVNDKGWYAGPWNSNLIPYTEVSAI